MTDPLSDLWREYMRWRMLVMVEETVAECVRQWRAVADSDARKDR